MGTQLPLPKNEAQPPNFQPMFVVAKRLDGSRCQLVRRQVSTPAALCLMGTSTSQKGHSPPIFGPCLLWPDGRPSQLLLSSCHDYVAVYVFKCSSYSLGCSGVWDSFPIIAYSKNKEILLEIKEIFNADVAYLWQCRSVGFAWFRWTNTSMLLVAVTLRGTCPVCLAT